jgi:GT2 family glycosyltransferase
MDGKEEPFITVVICTRNRGASVVRTVQTVLLNDYRRFEIIVVDQSDDETTKEALLPFAKAEQVNYIRMRRPGLSAGRNLAIQAARASEYIAITDDDCEVPRDWLRSLADAFKVDSHIGVVFGNVIPAQHNSEAGFIPGYKRPEPFLARSIDHKHEVEGVAGCMALRRTAWEALSGFDEMLGLGTPFPAGEEGDLAIRALLSSYFVYETPAVHLVHKGFYSWSEGRSVVYRNWFGTGAMFVKHLKCDPAAVAPLLYRIARRWAFGVSRSAVSLGRRSFRLLRLRAFVHGVLSGLRAPVNKRTRRFAGSPIE